MKNKFLINKNFILLVALILLSLLLFQSFFVMQYNDYSMTKQLLKNKTDKLQLLQFNYNNTEENEKALSQVKINYNSVNKIPLLNDYYDVIFKTYDLIRRNDLVELNTYILTNEEKEEKFVSHRFHIKVVGTLSNILNFIDDINSLNYFNEIYYVNISSENVADKSNLELNVYINFLGTKDKLTTVKFNEKDVIKIDDVFYIN